MPEPEVFVANLMSGSLSVIDPERGELKKNIRVGKYPVFSLVYPPDPEKILVTLHNYEKKAGGGFLLLVDPRAGRIIRKIIYPGVAVPSGMVWDSRRDLLCVADENLNCVWIHDGTTLGLITSPAAGTAPAHADLSKDGRHLAVANRLSADLMVFDPAEAAVRGKDALLATIPLGAGGGSPCHPYDVKFISGQSRCCVTDYQAGALLIVDIARQHVSSRIKLGSGSFGLALDRSGRKAFVCNMGSGSVSVIGIDRREETGRIAGLFTPCHCVLDAKSRQLIVSDQGGTTDPGVHVIDTGTGRLVKTVTDRMIRSPIGVTLGT